MTNFNKARNQQSTLNNVLLQGVLEGFIDGVLILTMEGELVHGNEHGRLICQQLAKTESHTETVPPQIWHVCQTLLECSEYYPNQPVIIDWELPTSSAESIRIRARWFELEMFPQKCILVTLENQNQSLESLTFSEVKAYGLTPREAEVWLLRRANYAYREIASQLFISLNTVKKHLKNIDLKIMLHTELETLLLGKGMGQAKVIKL